MRHTRHFWWEVFRRGLIFLGRFLRESLIQALLYLIIYITISGLIALGVIRSGFSIALISELASEFQLIVVSAFVALIILPLMAIILIPPRMYEDLGGFIDEPLVIIPETLPPLGKVATNMVYSSLIVKNDTAFDVEDCMLRLIDVIDGSTSKSVLHRSENLTWSNREKNGSGDETKTVFGMTQRVCDLAIRYQNREITEFCLAFGKPQSVSEGDFELIVEVTGKWKGHRFGYQKRIALECRRGVGNILKLADPPED